MTRYTALAIGLLLLFMVSHVYNADMRYVIFIGASLLLICMINESESKGKKR